MIAEPVLEFEGIQFAFWDQVLSSRHFLGKSQSAAVQEAPAYPALRAFDQLRRRDNIDRSELNPIIPGFRSRCQLTWELCQKCLQVLQPKHSAVREVWTELIGDADATVRKRTLRSMNSRLPRSYCVKILRQGLADRGSSVRSLAAYRIQNLLLKEMLPDLEQRLSLEKNDATKQNFEQAISMLRFGYFYNAEAGHMLIQWAGAIQTPGGKKYTRDYFAQNDHATIVEEFRQRAADSMVREFTWPDENGTSSIENHQ